MTMTDPLSPLAQRIYGVLVERMAVVHLSTLESTIGEQFGIGGPGWTALAELDSAGLIEILYDFRYRLTPLAWQTLLAAERARAEQKAQEGAELLQDRDRIRTLYQQAVKERDDKRAAWTTAEQEWAAIVRRKEGELSEARGELALVHADHKRVLAQLEQTEQISAAHFCEAEDAKKVIKEMLETLQRELRYIPHDQEQRWRKVAGLSEIKQ